MCTSSSRGTVHLRYGTEPLSSEPVKSIVAIHDSTLSVSMVGWAGLALGSTLYLRRGVNTFLIRVNLFSMLFRIFLHPGLAAMKPPSYPSIPCGGRLGVLGVLKKKGVLNFTKEKKTSILGYGWCISH